MAVYRPLVINPTNGRTREVLRADSHTPFNPQAAVSIVHDFIGSGLGELVEDSDKAGSGFTLNTSLIDSFFGTLFVTCGNDKDGKCFVGTSPNVLYFGHGETRFKSCIQLSHIASATQHYTARIGFIDELRIEPVDGAYFRYTDNVNSGKWQAVTRSNNTETATDTGVTVAATTSYKFEIRANAAGTSIGFYINGALVATNTTNIPTTSARATGYGAQLIKSVAGNAPRSIYVDYFCLEAELTSTR